MRPSNKHINLSPLNEQLPVKESQVNWEKINITSQAAWPAKQRSQPSSAASQTMQPAKHDHLKNDETI